MLIDGRKAVADGLAILGGGVDGFAVRWGITREFLRHGLEGGGSVQLVDLLRDICLHLVRLLQKV